VSEDLKEFIASEDLRKLVEKVDPSIKDEATKEADKLEEEEKELEELEDEAPSVDTKEQEYDKTGRKRYTAKTQPRDAQGKFRLVLARIKQNLGTSGNQNVLDKIQEAENLDNAGDYAGAVQASSDLIDTVDRLDSGALNAKSVDNVRDATADLGTVIANLPLPFENQAQKVRYSDLPAALKTLTKKLISRVEEKIGAEDAEIATKELREFMSGADFYSQAEISSQLNRMLRLLT
jgi:hypothetical protein